MNKKMPKKEKVFVAMSGGVDSSVTAALLKKSDKYDVSGVFIKGFYPETIDCTWREDRRDAMRVCALLDISFYTFDFSKEYKKHVIDYMVSEYKIGRTPNPDIMCNKYIKFDLFLKKAQKMGANKIATGHYVRHLEAKLPSGAMLSRRAPLGSFASKWVSGLLVARDKNKDQSYFLWTLKQKQIKCCLFPIGDYLKSEVRATAKKLGLPVAEKKDSQGLCFVGKFKMGDFLKQYIKTKPGKIVNESGRIIGSHEGINYYTIGQRHGTGAKGEKPYYVVGKNIKKNILFVATKFEEKNFYKNEVTLTDTNWISGKRPDFSKKYLARVRYRQPLQRCKIKIEKSKIKALFDEPQRAVTAGQSLVVYDGDTVLGGGIIK